MKAIPSPTELQLLALVTTERSGRAVAKLYEAETGKKLSYGTLYVAFRRLRDAGWVHSRDSEEGDRRVRYFSLTGDGAAALAAGRDHYGRLAAFGLAQGGP